jgi:hypothetical protein
MLGINYRWSSIILNKRSYFRLGSDDELKNPAYTDSATGLPVAGDHALDEVCRWSKPSDIAVRYSQRSSHHLFVYQCWTTRDCFQDSTFRAELIPSWSTEGCICLSIPSNRVGDENLHLTKMVTHMQLTR